VIISRPDDKEGIVPRPQIINKLIVRIDAVTRLWRGGLMALNITSRTIDEVIVVRLRGAILFGEESVSLRIRVNDLLGKSSQIVLDLGDVTRIDSGGLGTLVALYTSARKVGGDIKLTNLGNHAKEVLQITRLVTVFEIFGKTEDAITSFKLAIAAA
jgi:anti-sigma B factor antagonist